MRIQFDKARQDGEGFWLLLRAKSPEQAKRFLSDMQSGKLYDAEIKIHRDKRSLDSNAYLWILCQKVAERVRNMTKEEVYRDAVQHAGQWEPLVFKDAAVETFLRRWSGHGIGWFAEKLQSSDGYTEVMAYYGSSVYDTREMSVLLEYIVNEAKDIGIDTQTPGEIARMEALWDAKQSTA